MTTKMETPPDRTGNDRVDLDALYDYIHGRHFEHVADKERIRGALQAVTSKASYTITNDSTDRTFDANADDTLELADVVATFIRDVAAALEIVEVN